MTFVIVVGGCLVEFVVLCWLMWDDMGRVIKWLRKHEERISELEVKDYNKTARLDYQLKHLIRAKKDIKQLGKDVGWDDSKHGTQVMDFQSAVELANKSKKPPDEPPPNAA